MTDHNTAVGLQTDQNAIVGFPRWTSKASFSASSQQPEYPAANLGRLPLSFPWRSVGTDPGQTVLTAVFSPAAGQTELRRVDFVVIGPHNLSIGSQVTVTLYRKATHTGDAWVVAEPLVHTTEAGWPAVFTEDQVDWDGGRWWDRTYTPEEVRGYPWYLPIRVPGAHYCAAVRVEIVDPLNPDPFVQVGHLELAEAHQLPVNIEVGASYGYQSRVETQEADGGGEYHRARPKPRVFDGVVPYMPRETALGVWLEMRRQLDVNVPFFWWPNPADTMNRVRGAYMARFSDLSLHSFVTPTDRDSVPIRLKEVL